MPTPRRSGRRTGALKDEHLGEMIRKANKRMGQEAAIARLRQREHNLKKRRRKSGKRPNNSKWYPSRWEKKPGQPGFNQYVQGVMDKAGVLEAGADVRCVGPGDAPYDQPYQRTVAYLLHPKSIPNHRMLVAHRTGGGKTLTIIRVFSNFYHDKRPKLAIFPTADIALNFYTQLMAFENPYRDYVLAVSDVDPAKAARRQLSHADIDLIQKILELKGARGPNAPAAPLKAISYNQIGSKTLANTSKKLMAVHGPCSSTPSGRPNLMCDKIIMMDEAHNLVKPGKELMKVQISLDNLAHARESLLRAERSVVGLFTATPMVDAPEDIDAILRIVKGPGDPARNNEGFISAFYGSPASAYPTVTPTERQVPKVIRVELGGSPTDPKSALGAYLGKMLKKDGSFDAKFMQGTNRWVYDYASAHNTQQNRGTFQRDLATAKAKEMVPKLWAAAEYIAHAEGKVVVLTGLTHGFYALDTLIRTNPAFASLKGKVLPLIGKGVTTARADWKRSVQARNKGEDQAKQDFDADVFGKDVKALILNAEKFSEGVDFKDVRHVVLLDVAASWAKVLQRVGRAVRHCSAARLPPEQRTVNTVMLVASLPEYVRWGKAHKLVDLRGALTMDELTLLRVLDDRAKIESRMCSMIGEAFDRATLTEANGHDFCGGVGKGAVRIGLAPDDEQLEAANACHDKHSQCLVRAATKLGDHWEGMQQAAKLCEDERTACLADAGVDEDEGDAPHPNCPIGYGEGECAYYCEDYMGLEGEEAELCKQRRHPGLESADDGLTPAYTTDGSPSAKSSEKCASCPMGKSAKECAEHCVSAGLDHIDLYRCMARRTEGACEHSRKTVQKPATPAPPEGKVRKPDGSLIKAGGPEHRQLVMKGVLPPYDFADPPDKVYNPASGKLIKRGGPTHKKLCKEKVIVDCEFDPAKVVKANPSTPKPSRPASRRKSASRTPSRTKSRRKSASRSPSRPKSKRKSSSKTKSHSADDDEDSWATAESGYSPASRAPTDYWLEDDFRWFA